MIATMKTQSIVNVIDRKDSAACYPLTMKEKVDFRAADLLYQKL